MPWLIFQDGVKYKTTPSEYTDCFSSASHLPNGLIAMTQNDKPFHSKKKSGGQWPPETYTKYYIYSNNTFISTLLFF